MYPMYSYTSRQSRYAAKMFLPLSDIRRRPVQKQFRLYPPLVVVAVLLFSPFIPFFHSNPPRFREDRSCAPKQDRYSQKTNARRAETIRRFNCIARCQKGRIIKKKLVVFPFLAKHPIYWVTVYRIYFAKVSILRNAFVKYFLIKQHRAKVAKYVIRL